MPNSQSKDKITDLSKKAFARIEEEGLLPLPETYELWYVYYAGSNADVVRAVDVLVAGGKALDEDSCHEIHQRFLSDRSENERVRKAGDKIQETIEDVSSLVASVSEASEKYSDDLSNVTDNIDPNMTQGDMMAMLRDIASSTKDMISHNKTLEEKLADSSHVMEVLQHDLEVVKREALTDALTSLANRKAFDAEIMRVADAAEEDSLAFTLIMMDIDHFKKFNDDYGHQTGDQVLRLVAKSLTDGVKGRDTPARYGGEEFAVILPGTNLLGGMKVAEHLRQTVEKREIINRNSGEKLGRITMSLGVAEHRPQEGVDALIDRADAALYRAKDKGRNCVCVDE